MEISVIVPALNEEENIEACLKSILNQTFPRDKYEIIVSDGNSSDRTLKIARKYSDKAVITKKKGIWWGKNFGARFARGKYLVFIDADTTIDSDYLKTLHEYFKNGCIGLSTGFRFSGKSMKIKAAEGICHIYYSFMGLIGVPHMLGFSLAVTKADFDSIGGFKNIVLEDNQFCQDISSKGKVIFVPLKKVTTSSRRLENFGVMNSLRYYVELWVIQRLKIRASEKNRLIKNTRYINPAKNRS
jgi:glycosyltransferase involved in cell wall biosynthesis